MEENLSQARQTQNGIAERVDTGNLVIARFEHDLSRELDLQLHDHTLILNITQDMTDNGELSPTKNYTKTRFL